MNSVYEICFYGGLILAIIFFILSVILFIVLKIPKVIGELSGRAAKKGIKEKQQGKNTETSVVKKEQAKYYNQNSGKIKVRDTVSQETRKSNLDDTTDNLGKGNEQDKRPVFAPQFDPDETAVLGANVDLDEEIAKGGVAEELSTDILKTKEKTEIGIVKTSVQNDEVTDVMKIDDDEPATEVLKADDDEPVTEVLKADDDEPVTEVLKADDDEPVTEVLKADDDEPVTDVLKIAAFEDVESTTVLKTKKTRQLAHKAKVIYNIVVVNTQEKI